MTRKPVRTLGHVCISPTEREKVGLPPAPLDMCTPFLDAENDLILWGLDR